MTWYVAPGDVAVATDASEACVVSASGGLGELAAAASIVPLEKDDLVFFVVGHSNSVVISKTVKDSVLKSLARFLSEEIDLQELGREAQVPRIPLIDKA